MSLTQFQNINESLSSLVEETHIKLQAANSMRDAIRLRADSLKKMRLLEDPFERDKEYINFINYAQQFRHAREELIQIPMTPTEISILDKLTETLIIAQPVNEQAAEKLFDYVRDDSFLALIAKAESLQYELLHVLDALVIIENQNAQAALVRANNHYENAKYTLFALAMLVSVMVITIASIVIRLVGSKTQKVSYQAMHDPLTNLYNRYYLMQLAVDYLKIDGLLCRTIDNDVINYTMVKSINELAHLYGKKTVAKYVESHQILEKVIDLGIDHAQGYQISHPVKLSQITS